MIYISVWEGYLKPLLITPGKFTINSNGVNILAGLVFSFFGMGEFTQ